MHLQAENHKKGTVFQVWTSGNYNPRLGPSNVFHNRSENVSSENKISNPDLGNPDVRDGSVQTSLEYNHSTSDGDFATPGNMNDREINVEISHGSPQDGKTNYMLLCPANLQELSHEASDTAPGAELDMVRTAVETNVAPSETNYLALLKPLNSRVHQDANGGVKCKMKLIGRFWTVSTSLCNLGINLSSEL